MFAAAAALYCTGLIMESARALWLVQNDPAQRDRAKEYGPWVTGVAVTLCTVFWPYRFLKMAFKFLTGK